MGGQVRVQGWAGDMIDYRCYFGHEVLHFIYIDRESLSIHYCNKATALCLHSSGYSQAIQHTIHVIAFQLVQKTV
jgi:hypothetical protein